MRNQLKGEAWLPADLKYHPRTSEAPRPQGGASGKCRYGYRVGFPPRLQGEASSRLARDPMEIKVIRTIQFLRDDPGKTSAFVMVVGKR